MIVYRFRTNSAQEDDSQCLKRRVGHHSTFDTTQHVIFTQFTTSLWQLVNSSKIAQMEAAIAYLDVQDQSNYAAAARLYKLVPSTLTWRYQDILVSRTETTSTHHQRLNNVQEDTLLSYIDVLTDRHMSPTT